MSDFTNGLSYVRDEAYKAWQSTCDYAEVKAGDFVKESTKILFPEHPKKSQEVLKNYRDKASIVAFLAAASFLNSVYTRATPVFSTLACYAAYNAITLLKNAETIVSKNSRIFNAASLSQNLKKDTFLADWAVEFFAASILKEQAEEEKLKENGSTLLESGVNAVLDVGAVIFDAGKTLLGVMNPADKAARDIKYLRYGQGVLVVLIADAASKTFAFRSLATIAYGTVASLFFYNIYQVAQNAKDVIENPISYIKKTEKNDQGNIVDDSKVIDQIKKNTVNFDQVIETLAPTFANKYLFPAVK